MADTYSTLLSNPVGEFVAGKVGLPKPAELERYEPGRPVVSGAVLLGGAPGGRLLGAVAGVLGAIDAEVESGADEEIREPLSDAGVDAGFWNPEAGGERRFKALVFDATGISSSEELRRLREFFQPTIRLLESSGRLIVLGSPPELCEQPRERTAQRALEGFVRSAAKELRKGATAGLLHVAAGSEDRLASPLRFLLSPRSAYVDAQVIRVEGGTAPPEIDWQRPLAGKVALVTGASRGIGESIARTLARDGAHVVGVDVPPQRAELEAVSGEIGGSALVLDITEADAPARICDQLLAEHEGVDVVVHNAGVTRDKTLGRMDEERWSLLLEINLTAEERIDDALLERDVLRGGGRIVCVSSLSGIAGNAGQTNYATSKAGVIGMVEAMAPVLAEREATINAVAPGFIETRMTDAMPFVTREAGRRMNSLSQGGLPVDVAETIAFFASPASSGVNGNVVRVCGQSLLGA